MRFTRVPVSLKRVLSRSIAVPSGTPTAVSDQIKYAVFLDNPFPDAFEQVVGYFDSGFLPASSTLVVFRHYISNARQIQGLCQDRGVQSTSFRKRSQIVDLRNVLVFYPFNGQTNSRMVANRSCVHVLILHGESNKPASVKPLNRIYDYMLVAGELACDRLVESRVFKRSDIADGRIIRMGSTVAGRLPEFRRSTPGEVSYIAYLPTWEGGLESENFSSLQDGFGAEAAKATARSLGVGKVIVRLHQNTGTRDPSYVRHAQGALTILRDAGLDVSFLASPKSFAYRSILHPLENRGVVRRERQATVPVRLGIVDVSAIEAGLADAEIGSLVVLRNKNSVHAPSRYWDARSGSHLTFGEIQQFASPGFEDALAAADNIAAFRAAAISYTEPDLSGKSDGERMMWLSNYLKHDPFWGD